MSWPVLGAAPDRLGITYFAYVGGEGFKVLQDASGAHDKRSTISLQSDSGDERIRSSFLATIVGSPAFTEQQGDVGVVVIQI